MGFTVGSVPTARKERCRRAGTPWWATKSWLALVFVVASVAGFLLGVFGPILSQQKISKDQRALEKRIAESSQRVESLSRRVEVSRLLFDHYFGKSTQQQKAVITYLRYQFPEDLGRKSLQAVLTTEGTRETRSTITRSVASIKRVGRSKLDHAIGQERLGFQALSSGELDKARTAFLAAFAAFPTYHNVDEISQRVLTADKVSQYAKLSPGDHKVMLGDVIGKILSVYSWGIPPDLRPRLEAALNGST